MSRAAPSAASRPAQRPAPSRPSTPIAARGPRLEPARGWRPIGLQLARNSQRRHAAFGRSRSGACGQSSCSASAALGPERPARRATVGRSRQLRPSPGRRSRHRSPIVYQRPSQGQVSNFLNMPADSARGQVAASAPARPSQLPAAGGSRGQTVTGPGGGQITVGGIGGSRTGPGGTTVGAGRAGSQGHRARRQHLHQGGRRRRHPRPRRQYRGRRPRRLLRQRPVRRRQVVGRRERQLHPLGLLHARLVRPLSRRLVAGQVGGRGHGLGHGSLGHRRQLLRLHRRRLPTTTTAKT